ncbi:hypothetical protein MNEG_9816, partial [Monoraphidium neglectum]
AAGRGANGRADALAPLASGATQGLARAAPAINSTRRRTRSSKRSCSDGRATCARSG